MYIVSFYWTITTITTVGYGDISANNRWERIFCSLMMVIGVIAFGFANGSLFSILSSNDIKREAFDRKLDLLNHIKNAYNLPSSIYLKVKHTIAHDLKTTPQEVNEFVDQLPAKLKIEVNLFIHEERYKNI